MLKLPLRLDPEGSEVAYMPGETKFMQDAACKDHPGMFDTEINRYGKTLMSGHVVVGGADIDRRTQIRRARKICSACPVLDDCRSYIKKYPEAYNIWAGMLPEERAS